MMELHDNGNWANNQRVSQHSTTQKQESAQEDVSEITLPGKQLKSKTKH